LRRAIEQGIVAGAGLDVFEKEPPADWSLAQLSQVVATPHIAASTEEAQELVGLDTAAAVRDFLRDGVNRGFGSPTAWRRSSRRWARRASTRSHCATTARWPTAAPLKFWPRAR